MVTRKQRLDALREAMARALEPPTKSVPDEIIQAPVQPHQMPGPMVVPQEWIDWQQRHYVPGEDIPIPPRPPLDWRNYLGLRGDDGHLKAKISKRDEKRLDIYWDRWAAPTGADGYGSHVEPNRQYFALLEQYDGLSRDDIDWTKFRRDYFRLNRDQYALWQLHQEERKQQAKAEREQRKLEREAQREERKRNPPPRQPRKPTKKKKKKKKWKWGRKRK